MPRTRLLLVVLTLATWGLSSPRCSAEDFRSDSGHFCLQIPNGWRRFAPDKLAQVKAGMRRDEGVMHEGLEPQDFRPAFDGMNVPFMLIFEVPMKGLGLGFISHDQVERTLNSPEMRREFERGAGENAKLGKIAYDRQKIRFAADFDAQAAGGGPRVKGVLYGFLGKHNLVMVACFSREADFPRDRQTYDAMADSFRYDDGFQFVPFDMTRFLWIVAAVAGGMCCFVVVIIAVIAVAIMMLKR